MPRDRGRDESGTWGTDTMTVQDDELSYALGKQGVTRWKLERSSRAVVQYIGPNALFAGTREERRKAKSDMKGLSEQLGGPVWVDGWEERDDCAVVAVPQECVGYITGARRATLGTMEEELGVLMFFMNKVGDKGRGRGATNKLIIFGGQRERRGAELKVMNGIEKKAPGTCSRNVKEKTDDNKGFDTDRMYFKDEGLSCCIGKGLATQKNLEKAASCILQFCGVGPSSLARARSGSAAGS